LDGPKKLEKLKLEVVSEYAPEGHKLQLDDPGLFENSPEGHNEQLDAAP